MRASEQLHLTPQAISGQLRLLESALDADLFRKAGRHLELTEMGRMVLSYADEIFSLGKELQAAVNNGPVGLPQEFRVGVGDMVPKTIAFHLLQPALASGIPMRLVCREGRLIELLGELAIHRLDMVIADRPMPPEANVKGFNHFLGESSVSIFGTPTLSAIWAGEFPSRLNGAPFLMPGPDAAIRPRLSAWLEQQKVRPRIAAEFDDGALLKAFGKSGTGFFAAPTVLAAEICNEYGVEALGEITQLTEQFYAISVERQLRHPAVVAVTERARNDLFG